MRQALDIRRISLRSGAGLSSFFKIMAIIASIILGAMMMLTVADVIGRYFFNRPIRGTWELVGLLLVGAGTWGLAYCQLKKAHIRVDILMARFPPRIQHLIDFISYGVGAAGFGLISWRVFLLGWSYFVNDYVTDTLELSYYPFMFALTFGTGLIALKLLIDTVQSLMGMVKK